jgi:CheY-like chemotaxis protein
MGCRILIVEDNLAKKDAIVAALPRDLDCKPLYASSIAHAYRTIEGSELDVIILDMTFLVSRGTTLAVEPLAGVEVLQYLNRRRIAAQVIVATQHSSFSLGADVPNIESLAALHESLSNAFPRNYREVIQVNTEYDGWHSPLRRAVREAYKYVCSTRTSD